ncbi:MAG: Fis family transcriptional regulator [Myxococcales bacterium]|nr:Fis family transcriptional regulator [Myxococcales bacterium]
MRQPSLLKLAVLAVLAALAAPLLACGSSSGDGAGGSGAASSSGEPAEMTGMTAAHNAARAAVSPPASPPIADLVWDGSLGAYAQSYADNCVWQHSGGPYGENLYGTTGGATPADVVASWVAEASAYDYASNGCSGVCGHYTQVVWRDSLRLGCGVADCASGAPWGAGPWQIWVCSYDPPGNYVGEKPY